MEVGVEYNKRRLHGAGYFQELHEGLDYVPESVPNLTVYNQQFCCAHSDVNVRSCVSLAVTRFDLSVFEKLEEGV